MKPTILLGAKAYSPFRLDALKAAIAKADQSLPPLELDARWVYAIAAEGDAALPSQTDLDRAATLLNAEGPLDAAHFFVTPRKGTISPWSTKATDIFRNCSLTTIARVERGVRYRVLRSGSDTPVRLSPACLGALHDRMTEGVYESIDDLFDAGEPSPGRTYDVLGKGVEAVREANEELGLAISESIISHTNDFLI